MADFTGGPGLLAFIVTFSLVIVVVLLLISLTRHLRKVRAQDDPASAGSGDTDPEKPTASSGLEDGQGDGDVVADESGDR